ncbi:MAG: hypothetical protein ACYTXA_05965 [Nostoc sp.]
MASIDQVKSELANATAAIADLKQAAVTEKQEIKSKLDDFTAKINTQTTLIEQLQTEIAGEIPDSLLSELTDATDSLKEISSEIRGLVDAPIAATSSPTTSSDQSATPAVPTPSPDQSATPVTQPATTTP